MKHVAVYFFQTAAGGQPVRDWLKGLTTEERQIIGFDLALVELGWPVGMPLCRALGNGLHEVRSTLNSNKISRIFFYIDALGRMVLLHGFIKKTQQTPLNDLQLAQTNKRLHQASLRFKNEK